MWTHTQSTSNDCHSDMPEDAKSLHRMTAMRMLGEGRTTEEEQLLLKMEKMEKEGKEKGAEKSPLLKSRHPQLPVFTSSVKLQSQAGRGRFLVAAKDISPGIIGKSKLDQVYCAWLSKGLLCLYILKRWRFGRVTLIPHSSHTDNRI